MCKNQEEESSTTKTKIRIQIFYCTLLFNSSILIGKGFSHHLNRCGENDSTFNLGHRSTEEYTLFEKLIIKCISLTSFLSDFAFF